MGTRGRVEILLSLFSEVNSFEIIEIYGLNTGISIDSICLLH